MSWNDTFKQHGVGGGVGLLLALGLGLALQRFDFKLSESLIHLSYDLPFLFRPVEPPTEVVMVYLDDDSHRNLRQPYFKPWDRGLYAAFLERLTAERARAVAFDIIFSDLNADHPEGDQRFARAIKANGRVVLGADYAPAAGGIDATTFIRAIDPFWDAQAGWGMVQLLADQDFIVRRHLHVPPKKDDDLYSSVSWELARVAGAPLAKDPQARYRERWINYYGPPKTIPYVSFQSTLDTNVDCPAGFFSNKVVLVGASLKTYASGVRKDEFRTPYTRGAEFVPAVDVHAAQVLNLLRGDWLSRPSPTAETLVIVAAALLFGFGLPFFRPLQAVGLAAAGAVILLLVTGLLFFKARLWFPWLIVLGAQIPIALLWSVVFNSVQLYVQNRLYQQSLQMYLSPKLVRKFAGNKDLLKPGAKKELLTMLFSDITNFTSISEGMDSDELARCMNTYFQTAVSQCIHPTDGTIVKYIGDGIFAFWNAPDAQPDHALRACHAALRLRDEINQSINGEPVITRIGLHTGIVDVGNFGSTTRIDYTAIGENINLASRIESLNKFLGTDILISAETREHIADQLLTRFVGDFRLAGFARKVSTFELIGGLEEEPRCRHLHEAFAAALAAFQDKDLAAARAGFRRVLELEPEDGPSRFYLRFLSDLSVHSLPSDWTSVVQITDKWEVTALPGARTAV